MSTNPFEDNDAQYRVLVNDEGQHSLWPAFAEVPAGWTVAHPEDSRQACLDYVNENWTDMRPLSLVRQMEGAK
ncbi:MULTISPECIES: MbtH family protein [Streptomyces]|jgi:MbtH protein|uniref:Cal4 n=2 Tax=Streptomyces TaxID=1883 RepID=A0A0N9M601_9ACTN|nr:MULTISPECIES: MbtH family protein [Streptomyces]ALG65332.1 Cal4 [Streptomyces calvus]MBA8942984.1 MbtH protein [Streptomyces calvus]MBA8978681.1 MbtH protein [Streptomyces calvus]MYS31912.1 MbtH family NRPS accessory protein [Streptomyces sp. SID7804]QDI71376.1 MbtH family protein [Streptomyces calvus]